MLIQANSSLILIAFWDLQNTYLAKHLQMLDSTHSTQQNIYAKYLKTAWLSARINKIPNSHLLVQS